MEVTLECLIDDQTQVTNLTDRLQLLIYQLSAYANMSMIDDPAMLAFAFC